MQNTPTSTSSASASSGLGLPDRDYYLDPKFKSKLAAYQVYLEKLLTLAKIPDAKQAAADIVALETQIAKIAMVQGREPRCRKDLQQDERRLPWPSSRRASTGSSISTTSAPRT